MKSKTVIANIIVISMLISLLSISQVYSPVSNPSSTSCELFETVSSPSQPPSRSSRGDSVDYELTGTHVIDNIILTSFSRMIIKDADVTVNGVIFMEEYSTIFIIDSTVVINPPEIHENTSVINLNDLSSIRISNSNITVNPCPNPTSVPFIITNDQSSFFITDSIFTTILPAITEMRSKIEGSLITSGGSTWIVKNTYVNAIVNNSGGWFWHALVGGSMDIIGSTFYCESHMVDLFAHSFGHMRIIDSHITGRTMWEGTATGEIINSTLEPEPGGFTSLGIIDSTTVTIVNSTFKGLVGLNNKATVDVYNSVFDENRGVRVPKNASLSITDCEVAPKCDLYQNGTLSVYGTHDIKINILDFPYIGVYSNCTVSITESSIAYLKVNELDNVFLFAENSQIDTISTNAYAGIYGSIDHSTIMNVSLGEDNIFNLTLNNGSRINELISNTNCSVNVTLIDDSVIENITRGEDAYLITTIDAPTPEITGSDVVIDIMHRLYVRTTLNANDISTTVDVSDNEGDTFTGQSIEGNITFVLLYQKLDDSGIHTIDSYQVTSSYYGLGLTKSIILDKSKVLFMDFEDYTPPEISDFKYEKKLWNLENKVTNSMRVEVRVVDGDIKEVSNVTIRYSTNEGKTWRDVLMTSLGDGVYEGIIPEKGAGTTVRFSVVANDVAHNSASTSIVTFQEGVGNLILIWSLILLFIVLVILTVVIKIYKSRKIKRYIKMKNTKT